MKVYDTNFIKNQFPALQRKVWDKKLVYLDSAASMQKPKRVLDAISKSYSFNYSNVHRGLHKLSEEATAKYEGSRIKVANFVNCSENNSRSAGCIADASCQLKLARNLSITQPQ